jgi:predicted RNA methylase
MVNGQSLTLTGQLDRKMYAAVAKIIELAGGKWNKKAKCHLFAHDAAETIEPLLLTGEISDTKKDFGQFDTPASIARLAVSRARIEPGMWVLEPSAGLGSLVIAIEQAGGLVEAFEIDARRLHTLKESGCMLNGGVHLQDFLATKTKPVFDRVLMNPPFAGQADIKHVTHAMEFLKPGGRLVAIMSNGVAFRTNKATLEFRDLMERHGGEITPLPEGAFKESGTGVNTVMITMDARQ